MDYSEITVVEELRQNFADLSKEELIEQVQRQKKECALLKEKLKYTESFIIDPSSNKKSNQKQEQPTQYITSKQTHKQPTRINPIFHRTPSSQKYNKQSFNGQKPPLGAQLIRNKPKPLMLYCSKMHMLHMFKARGSVNCSKCNKNCQNHCWGCMGCKHFECLKCQPHSKYYCPYNDFLRPSITLNIDVSNLACSICEASIKDGNSLSCAACLYNLCSKCLK